MRAGRVSIRDESDAGPIVTHVESADQPTGELHRSLVVFLRAARQVKHDDQVHRATAGCNTPRGSAADSKTVCLWVVCNLLLILLYRQ